MNIALNRWRIEDARELYAVRNWGAGYFAINDDGEVVVTPFPEKPNVAVSLTRILAGIRDRGLDLPVLLRIQNILDSQIRLLHETFHRAIADNGYQGAFRGVYPIKVNQQAQVLTEIARFGSQYHHGLEAGSKAELIAALSVLEDPEACLVCNGYKDEEFIDLGLFAVKMGFKCFFVVEMPGELDLILERSRALEIKPCIGVRVKLASRAGGHWTESSGDRSVFGLNVTQLIDMVDRLRDEEMLDCLMLLHYHIGSQVPNIRDIRSAAHEASRMYAELVQEGAAMGYLDMGGGLAVDYDGSHTNYTHSRNYTLEEYCADIIEAVMESLDDKEIPHPTIITESGRATVAYYSVLLADVLDVASFEAPEPEGTADENDPEIIRNLDEMYRTIMVRNLQERYNDALYYRDEMRQLFKIGTLSLRERSRGENIFWNIMQAIARQTKEMKHPPKELEDLDTALTDIYYLNFSIFQSVPDSWAIDHLFPIMPVHRLHEKPTRQAILADITCDCDGKIDRFIDPHTIRTSLPLHELKENEDYYLGIFLVGAYQETLGDLHNLMGDTNVVTIRITEDGEFDIIGELEGDSVADVLSYVEFDPKDIKARFLARAEQAVRQGKISAQERRRIMKAYTAGLRGYTYFER